MATASKMGPQDLPPLGGYAPIQTERIKLKTVIGYKIGIATFIVTNVIGWAVYNVNYRRRRREIVEMRSARLAMLPALTAERDRAFLKQINKNLIEEEDLMKDYPGWEVGTYFGEPVFKSLPEGTFVEPQFNEFAAHAPSDGTYMVRNYHRHLV